jgi:hypothetical protein
MPSRRTTTGATLLLGGILNLGCTGPEPAAPPVVNRVDHVVLQTSAPQALYDLFTVTMGLPSAWPYTAYPGMTSGGICLGNVNLETLDLGYGKPAAIWGIVLEPQPLDQVLGEIGKRGAGTGAPIPQMAGPVLLWTSVFLDNLCRNAYVVYLCEYSPGYLEKLRERTGNLPAQLGGIGLNALREVLVGCTDPAAAAASWDALAAPARADAGLLTLGTGPRIRLVPAAEDRILALVLEVASLPAARAFLEAKGLLGAATADELRLTPTAVQGLDIRLVQK